MPSFTLRVIDDQASGLIIPDTLHSLGGFDSLQASAFNHLFPDGSCPWVYRTLLWEMAEIHGWKVVVTARKTAEVPAVLSKP